MNASFAASFAASFPAADDSYVAVHLTALRSEDGFVMWVSEVGEWGL